MKQSGYGGNEFPDCESPENPPKQQAKPKLPPRALDILFSQSPGFCILRVVMGTLLGLLLRQLFAPPKIF